MTNRKHAPLLGLFLLLIALLLRASGAPASEEPQSPSELSKKGKPEDVTFVLAEKSDLRMLFCDETTLKSRVSRKVCVLDDAFKGPREIELSSGKSVRDVVSPLVRDAERVQIRLITANAIEQTPHPRKPDQKAVLLDRQVQPGDIVVIAAHD